MIQILYQGEQLGPLRAKYTVEDVRKLVASDRRIRLVRKGEILYDGAIPDGSYQVEGCSEEEFKSYSRKKELERGKERTKELMNAPPVVSPRVSLSAQTPVSPATAVDIPPTKIILSKKETVVIPRIPSSSLHSAEIQQIRADLEFIQSLPRAKLSNPHIKEEILKTVEFLSNIKPDGIPETFYTDIFRHLESVIRVYEHSCKRAFRCADEHVMNRIILWENIIRNSRFKEIGKTGTLAHLTQPSMLLRRPGYKPNVFIIREY